MNEELLTDFEEVIKEKAELRVQEYRFPDGRWEIVEFEMTKGILTHGLIQLWMKAVNHCLGRN